MPLKHAIGIVIQSFDYGESDRIITFYTLEHGKIKGIAKGARRSRKRFGNSLDLLCYIRLIFFEKEERSLVRVEQCDVVDFFSAIGLDFMKMAYGSYFAELVDAMVGERQPNREVFELLAAFLSSLSREPVQEEMLSIYEMRLLSCLGYRPNLDSCTLCRAPLEQLGKIHFVSAKGGILCERCCSGYMDAYPITAGTVRLLERAAGMDLAKICRLRFTPQSLSESREILPRFIRYHLNKELKSYRFLKQVGGTTP